MKKAILLAAMSVFLFSCKKDVLNSTAPSTSSEMKISDFKQEKVLNLRTDATVYNNTYQLTGKFYNTCTQETVVVSGMVKEQATIKIIGDTVETYSYVSSYSGVKGIGQTTGAKYTGSNDTYLTYRAVKDIAGNWTLTTETVSGKLVFTTPNQLSYNSSVYYHAKLDQNGQLYFDIVMIDFESCK